ncbi:calmodulin binding protein PICBP [Brassica rapa]|uniref:calmodulin binding protein PICBP n=1 Tax=Brassica campestris TaxID=3711 RepID=UPI000872E7BD|nr:calmodulin binding protein PICBP [Brassica rapa]XP_033143679.1 calmodulin binding protein PICBP [Brassica rapa]
MVQRKTTCQAIKSYNLQPETRFGPEMMMMMKRTKPKRKLKDSSVSQSGKTQSTPSKHDLVVKGTGRSPNYMKGTSSSEARMENKKIFNPKNQTCKKERCSNKPGSRIVRGLTKAPNFKRCSQRATCSSTLKDSKFPEYLMVNHDGTDDGEVSGTSVLRVCPYTYCSLNGHLHKQYPPLKSFVSSRRQSLTSQKSVKKEDVVEMYVEEKKECESVDGGTFETQISETVSEGAPRSETDSDEYSDTAEIVKFSEGDDDIESQESDLEETLVQKTCEVDDDSDSAEMVRFLEGDHDIELKENVLEETMADDSVKEIEKKANIEEDVDQSCSFNSEAIGMMMNSEADDADEETLKDSKEESQDQTEAVPTLQETTKVPYNHKQRPCNQEGQSNSTVSWTIIKCKKPVAETEDLREFNPREPSYLPVSVDADAEKVDLKHQDMNERKNSEDWMFDYALQRAVTKLSSAKKRKVALLVEAFETVKPVVQHGREPDPVLSYGRHLQTCS